VSDRARARLAADSYPELTDVSSWLSSRSLVVRSAAGGGHVVLVANGRDGLARRAPDSTWERVVFQPYGQVPLVLPGAVAEERTARSRFAELRGELALSVVIGCLAFLVAAEVDGPSPHPVSRRWPRWPRRHHSCCGAPVCWARSGLR
jgi:hypothetical protein